MFFIFISKFYAGFTKITVLIIVGFFSVGLLIGGLTGYFLQTDQETPSSPATNVEIDEDNTVSQVYYDSSTSVVLISSLTDTGSVQGSGFV